MKHWVTKNGIHIHRILRGRCNCYLVSNQDRYLLIDSAMRKNWKSLTRNLDKLGVTKDASIALVLTHCHFDHAENAAKFKETYKAPVIVHRNEGLLLKNGDNPIIGGTMFFTKILAYILNRPKFLARFRYRPTDFDRLVDEKVELKPFGISGYILHTPGHTPGSTSVIIDNEIGMVGDAMFGVLKGSVFPPFADDPKQMVKSWKRLLDTGCRIYLPAHGTERTRDIVKRQYEKCKRVFQ
jgi:hydroxyacylglutathione hydrolase